MNKSRNNQSVIVQFIWGLVMTLVLFSMFHVSSAIHELGNLTVAKLLDIPVSLMLIGSGFTLLSFEINETIYKLCASPINGRVSPTNPPWPIEQEWLVAIAGPISKLLTPIICILILRLRKNSTQLKMVLVTLAVIWDNYE